MGLGVWSQVSGFGVWFRGLGLGSGFGDEGFRVRVVGLGT